MPLPPHPANVPGEFYVEDGCCTLCEVPLRHAPGLFGWWPNADAPKHCFVKKQPENAAELEQMVDVIRCAELQCIHYRGADRELQVRLINFGEGLACDNLPPELQMRAELMEAEKLREYRLASEQPVSFWTRVRWWLKGKF